MLYSPLKAKPTGRKTLNPFARERRILRRRRSKLRIQLKIQNKINPTSNKIIKLKAELYDINLKIKESIENQNLSKETKVTEKIEENPHYFYSYAKSFSKQKSTVGPLFNKDNGP